MIKELKGSIESFFIKSKALKLKLINRSIERPLEKLPTSNRIASLYDISDITVKKVIAELAESGYLKANKKAGTKVIKRFSNAQRELFENSKEQIKKQIERLEKNEFNTQEILSCLYSAALEYSFDIPQILYTESDSEMVSVGAEELSDMLNIKIKPVYFGNIQKELSSKENSPKAIIVPFYCLKKIEDLQPYATIFPLHITRPLEYLSNSKSIVSNANVMYVTVSNQDKEGAYLLEHKITQYNFYLKICTIEEAVNNPSLLDHTDIVVTYKWVAKNNESLFKNVPQVIEYNRFNDKEGLAMIKHFIDSNKLGG